MTNEKDKWKNKYLSSLDNSEIAQKRWQQESALLKEGIAKVCVAAQGQDSALDKRLLRLREILRDPKADISKELNTQLRALETQLLSFDEHRQQRLQRMTEAFAQIIMQLQELGPAKRVMKKLKKFEQQVQLSKSAEVIPDTTEWAQNLTALLGETLQVPSDSIGDTRSWLQRLLGENNSSKKMSQQKPDQDSSTGLQFNDEKAADDEQTDSEIAATLTTLLEQINIPDDATEQAEQVKRRLGQRLGRRDLARILEEINAIVLVALDLHQREFETFLASLDNRLVDAQGFLQEAVLTQQRVFRESSDLDQQVRDQVQDLNADVGKATDLEQLKTSVKHKLDIIVSSLDQVKQNQHSEQTSLSDQLKALVERVASMEQESNIAQEHLEEQRHQQLLDYLTQLPNRQSYEQRLNHERSLSRSTLFLY